MYQWELDELLSLSLPNIAARLAQLVENETSNLKVMGSNRLSCSIKFQPFKSQKECYSVVSTDRISAEIAQLRECHTDDLKVPGRDVQIRSDRIRSHFGTKILISDQIGLEKLFRSRIGSDFVIGRPSLFQLVIFLCISRFIFNLTKHFHFH